MKLIIIVNVTHEINANQRTKKIDPKTKKSLDVERGQYLKMFEHLHNYPQVLLLPVWESNEWQRAAQNSFSFHPSLPKNWVHK